MENTEQNGQNNPRLDRLEKLMDLLITDHLAFSDEHKRLLTAQVVLTDGLDKLAAGMRELAEAQKDTDARLKELAERTDARLKELAEHTDGQIGVLVQMMDEFIRRRGENQ